MGAQEIIERRARSLRGAWKNLKLARRYHLRVLSPGEIDDVAALGRRPDCARCTERCCASPKSLVSLRLLDIARLIDAGLEDAIVSSAAEHAESDETWEAILEVEHLDSWRRFPMIRKRSDGRCALLDDEGRCSAYEARPLQCRAFPFLVGSDLASVRWAGFCRSFADDGSDDERSAALAAALESFHAKQRDLVSLAHGWDVLEELGLTRWLRAS